MSKEIRIKMTTEESLIIESLLREEMCRLNKEHTITLFYDNSDDKRKKLESIHCKRIVLENLLYIMRGND